MIIDDVEDIRLTFWLCAVCASDQPERRLSTYGLLPRWCDSCHKALTRAEYSVWPGLKELNDVGCVRGNVASEQTLDSQAVLCAGILDHRSGPRTRHRSDSYRSGQ